MRHLGIDYGKRKVGIAISDEAGRMAFPREILVNDDKLLGKVADLVQSENVEQIVIGKSINFENADNPIMKLIHGFAAEIEKRTEISVAFQDERYTTTEARYTLNQKGDVDAAAAALILQAYIDSHD